jgi:tetratricopeptide (TPR) repeat protein
MSLFERMLARSRLRDARQRLSQEPSPQTYAALAEEHARAGDMESVLQVCAEGLDLFPEEPALERLAQRARQLSQEGRLRELSREIREAPRPALYREMCEILLESGRWTRAEEVAGEWYLQCDDPAALLTQARACAERFFADRGREEGRRAWELLDRFEKEAPLDERALRLRARLASAVGSWSDAIRAVIHLLEILPGDRPLEARFRALSTMPGGAKSFEQGLRELEKTGRFAEEVESTGPLREDSSTAIRPLLKELGTGDGVQAALYTRGSTALVQGLKGATAERTARAVREVVQHSRTTARRLGIGQGVEIQLEGEFGMLLVVAGEEASAGLWQRGNANDQQRRALAALVSGNLPTGEVGGTEVEIG